MRAETLGFLGPAILVGGFIGLMFSAWGPSHGSETPGTPERTTITRVAGIDAWPADPDGRSWHALFSTGGSEHKIFWVPALPDAGFDSVCYPNPGKPATCIPIRELPERCR